VVGEYHDVGRFLTAVASLPRIITPTDMELDQFTGAPPSPDIQNPVVARFRIQTYVIPDGSGPMGEGFDLEDIEWDESAESAEDEELP